MKKNKLKALAKKSAFQDIKIKLISDLTEVASSLGNDSKKIRKTIEKESKKIAKKISGKLVFNADKPVKLAEPAPRAAVQEPVQAAVTKANPTVRQPRTSSSSLQTDRSGAKKKYAKRAAEVNLPQA